MFAAIELARRRAAQAMAEAAAAAQQQQAAPPQPAEASKPIMPPVQPAPDPLQEVPMQVAHRAPRATGALQGMFQDGNTLLRAIVASEILGPPAAHRENDLWNLQPNEPST